MPTPSSPTPLTVSRYAAIPGAMRPPQDVDLITVSAAPPTLGLPRWVHRRLPGSAPRGSLLWSTWTGRRQSERLAKIVGIRIRAGRAGYSYAQTVIRLTATALRNVRIETGLTPMIP